MNRIRHFFRSFWGRLTCRDYLLAWGVLFALEIFIFFGGAAVLMADFYIMSAGFSVDTMVRRVMVILILSLYIAQTVLAMRRLHVLGCNRFWALLAPLSSVGYFLVCCAFINDISENWSDYTPSGKDSLGLGAGLMILLGLTPWISQFFYLLIGLLEEKHAA